MIFRSPSPPAEIPNLSLTDYVLAQAGARAEKPALIDGPTGRTLTYGQLAGGIRRVATGLAQRGFAKGDVFAMMSPNLPEYAVAFHGVAAAGGVVTTVNPLYTAHELTLQLRDSGAHYLLTIPQFLATAQEAAHAAGIQEIFVFGEAEGATPFAALLQNDGQAPAVIIDPAEDLIVLPYSSGTTGLPKGVMLTHRNLVANLAQVAGTDFGVFAVGEDDMIMGVLPFFHIYGMVVIMNYALAQGATIVTMPRFDLPQFLDLTQKHRITGMHIVPPIALALAKHPLVDQYDLSSLRFLLSAAAPLGAAVEEACRRRLGAAVSQGYGMTEASPITHLNPQHAHRPKPGSIGPAVVSTAVKVVDLLTQAELGPNQEGELWISGPQIMKGYLNNPQATANTVDRDGWLHTGDIGYADEDGYFTIVDRLKELIKYKGFQVAPAELESVILGHEAVADVAVIGVADEEAGELPKAFVVLKQGHDATAEDILEFVATRVAPFKKVRAVEFLDQIPKSASGKILRRVLVEQERARAAVD